MGTRDSWGDKKFTCICQTKKTGILWTYIEEERGLPEKEIIQGSTPGFRTRGRPKTTWLDNITSWTRLSLTELVMNVEDRQKWKKDRS